jgi:F-type H+-transporting ATPase subunit delta
LFEAQRIIDSERELRAVLSDRRIPSDHKATLIGSIFEGKVAAATLALIRQAAAGRTGSFDAVLERFADQVAARRNRTLAEVRSATALGDAELERLSSALSAKYGHPVHLNTIVDPTIIGGLKVAIGDDIIDGTIAGRLEDARRQLAG